MKALNNLMPFRSSCEYERQLSQCWDIVNTKKTNSAYPYTLYPLISCGKEKRPVCMYGNICYTTTTYYFPIISHSNDSLTKFSIRSTGTIGNVCDKR